MRLTDEQIGAELYALRETPDPNFAAKLDLRASAGFPTEKAEPRDRMLTWGRLGMVLAPLAAIAVVAVVISSSDQSQLLSSGSGNDSAKQAAPSQTIAPAQGQALSKGGQAATAVPPTQPIPPNGSRPRNGRPQVQERTAQLGLATDADKLQTAADGVVDVTDRYGGFVDSSNVRTGGSRGRASFALRIPTVHLQDALSDISDLGRVTLLNQGSTNVTPAYVDAGKNYRAARAKVDGLIEQLENASSSSEADAIRAQLGIARDELAAARAALRGLKQPIALTPVRVEITAQGDGSWSIGDAADDAVGVLEAIVGAALITLAVLVPLAALLALGWLGTREVNRRRREAALD